MPDDAATVEAAMVRIRRRQTRGALASASRTQVADSAIRTLDAIEAEQSPTVGSIAITLGVDQPRASRLVAQVISLGYAARVADQADGRRAFLTLTSRGRALLAQVRDRRRAAMSAAMADWSPDERAEFARLLTRFVDAMP